MKPEAKRLKKATPDGGGFDMTFSVASPEKDGTRRADLNLIFFKKAEEGKSPQIAKKVTVSGIGESAEDAQTNALSYALDLLGV